MPSRVPGVLALQGFDVRAGQIEQCKIAVLTSVAVLGPMHALLVGDTGPTATVLVVLLTGAQAFAIFSIISVIFVARELKKDADLEIFVVRIPIVCCSAAGALLVLATCIVHWKATYGIAALAVVFLVVVHRDIITTFGKGIVNCCASALGRLRAARAGEVDVEMGPVTNSASAENGEGVDGLRADV